MPGVPTAYGHWEHTGCVRFRPSKWGDKIVLQVEVKRNYGRMGTDGPIWKGAEKTWHDAVRGDVPLFLAIDLRDPELVEIDGIAKRRAA